MLVQFKSKLDSNQVVQTARLQQQATARTQQQTADFQNQNFQQETLDNVATARAQQAAIRSQGIGPGNNTRAPNVDTDGDGIPDIYVPGMGDGAGTGTGSSLPSGGSNRS